MARKVKSVGATDKEIKASLARINAKIRGWKKEFDPIIFEKKIENLQDATHYNEVTPSGAIRHNLNYEGKDYIPVTKENIEYFKNRIKATDKANARKSGTLGKEINQKNVLEELESYETAAEEIKNTIKDIKEGNFIGDSEDVYFTKTPSKATKEQKAQAKELNRRSALEEIMARYTYDFKSDFHDVIDVLYEDEVKNADLISRLQSEQWSGELMHAVDIRASAWDLPDKEPRF